MPQGIHTHGSFESTTRKSEKHMLREQPQLHVQLGYKNGSDGTSYIHRDKISPLESHDRHPNSASEPGGGGGGGGWYR